MKRTRARRRSRAEKLARMSTRHLDEGRAAGGALPLDPDDTAEVVRPPAAAGGYPARPPFPRARVEERVASSLNLHRSQDLRVGQDHRYWARIKELEPSPVRCRAGVRVC